MSDLLASIVQFWPIALVAGLALAPVRHRGWAAVVLASALLVNAVGLPRGWVNPYIVEIEVLICITGILAVSLNLINGLTGQFSIGHAGFMAVGAYTAGIMSTFVFRLTPDTSLWLGAPAFAVSLLAGGLAAAVFGLVVGLPTLRLRGDYLAIATIGFAEIMRVVLQFVTFRREIAGTVCEVGGPTGLSSLAGVPVPAASGLGRDAPSFMAFAYALLVLAGVVWAIRNFAHSSHGRACGAIREDEVAAEILGVDTVFYKVGVFVLGAFFAGVGGGLYAHATASVYPSMAGFLKSIEVLIIIYIGGIGSISGAVLAAALVTVLGEALVKVVRVLGEQFPDQTFNGDACRMALYGLILIAIILWRPQGLYGGREFAWLAPRRARRGDGHP